MDTGRTDIKTITEALVRIVEAHTNALKEGMEAKNLLHGKIIDGLMKALTQQGTKTPTIPTIPIKPEVLPNLPDTATRQVVEHFPPMVEFLPTKTPSVTPPSTQLDTPPEIAHTQNEASKPAMSVPQGDVTLDNIDQFSEAMEVDSLQDIKVEKIKK